MMNTFVSSRRGAGQGRLLRDRAALFSHVAIFLLLAGGVALLFLQEEMPDGAPATEAGRAVVIDGDSLRVGEREIRLYGVDAPEYDQVCRDERDESWPCGRAARDRMKAIVGAALVSCAGSAHDKYGRTLAVCSAGAIEDIGEEMVRDGYAIGSGGRYALAEAEARAAGLGLWRGTFDTPREWRDSHPRYQFF
ncbi:MAG: thermonuclease family protein [Bauldia sp.]|nr:thermonuclease family protein [Bauldia sp.]